MGLKMEYYRLSKKNDMKTDSGDQRSNILDTPGQRRFDDFLEQIEEE